MTYEVLLQQKDEPVWFSDTLLDFYKKEIAMTRCDFVKEELRLCDTCQATCDLCSRCHVLVLVEGEQYAYNKHCPVLFHDIIQPRQWMVEDLL